MLSRVALALGAALVVTGPLAGCDDRPPLVVRKVLIDIEPAAEGRADRERVRDTVRALLRRSESFELKEGAADGATLRLRLFAASEGRHFRSTEGRVGAGVDPSSEPPPPSSAHPGAPPAEGAVSGAPARVSLSLSIIGEDKGGRYHYRGAGLIEELPDPRHGVDLDELITRAVDDAIDEVAIARSAQDLPSEQLIARLQDDQASSTLKRQAVQALGKRRDGEAVPALSAVLQGDDPDLANTALRALTDIGDPRAVDAIIAYSDGKPSIVRRQAIEAVRGMGTRKGKAWLFTLSTGHPDPDVQAAAAAALASLGGAEEEAPKVAESGEGASKSGG